MGLIAWLVAIGCLLLGAAVGIWGFTDVSKTIAIWLVGFPGAVLILIAAGLELQKIADRQLQATNGKPDSPDRAWISLEITSVGALSYDGNGWDAGVRWHIPISYQLKNTGNTPALNVDFFVNMLPFLISYWPEDQIKNGKPEGEPMPGTDAPAELKKLCEAAKFFAQNGGQTMFRGSLRQGVFHINGDPSLFEAAKSSKGFSGNILIVACATYRIADDERWHQTGESFALFRPNNKIDFEGGSIPASELALTAHPMGGNFAN